MMSSEPLPPRPTEAVAYELARALLGERILCTTAGRAQAAIQLAADRPTAQVTCWFLDEHLRGLAAAGQGGANLALLCAADPPAEPIDLAVLPLSMSGDAELTRDLLQLAFDRLTIGGKLVAVTNNRRDLWLRTQLADYTKHLSAERGKETMAYLATKNAPLKRLRNYQCEFAFRDAGNLTFAISRPGVFSHRHIDPGARRLLEFAEVTPNMKVLDIGCGAGTVALALARRESTCQVTAIDSNIRAVECARAGVARNELANVEVHHHSAGAFGETGRFDLAVANPPYFSDYEIAERFVAAAHRSLRRGGKLLLVTKNPTWYAEHLPRDWGQITITESKQYFVASAVKP
jgi:16S rRNA G1207 methylase RsmC